MEHGAFMAVIKIPLILVKDLMDEQGKTHPSNKSIYPLPNRSSSSVGVLQKLSLLEKCSNS